MGLLVKIGALVGASTIVMMTAVMTLALVLQTAMCSGLLYCAMLLTQCTACCTGSCAALLRFTLHVAQDQAPGACA